ncbi:hypothetical protein KSF_089210 [Reticulibacter mediterranei]|uniref:7-cyano-7-deazaguanine synthase n=1 Tax=Reticulibacter mediterranei TaxID=2778369 RepID=A0A8J3N7Q7_9CHLR|nr:7-cyano-7-deazaguanine synthase [Reticulibacter mediterranei]GHO98873.1 hypothetical protein KSF_089210 [Reticulibacter mediterranei]
MRQPDYTYHFDDLEDAYSPVRCIASASKGVADTCFVRVDDSQVAARLQRCLPGHLADCVDLAVAVAVADRLSLRRNDSSCHIQIILPLRYPERFKAFGVIQQLESVLYWYTHDHWSFEFLPRERIGRLAERQLFLFSSDIELPRETALWSGGLDSLAGLYSRISCSRAKHFLLVGTGMNTQMFHTQRQAAHEIASLFPGDTTLVQIPYGIRETKELQKHSLQRSRGFVFLLIGAVCAVLQGFSSLALYENGIGAMNLPYCDAEVGLDHSLSVHPLSLLRMEEFISQLLGTTFTLHNPFLFQTKAEMCQALLTSQNWEQLVLATFTCDRPHRDHPQQCGYCSSCLLRRQALAALKVEDPTQYVITTLLSSERTIRPSDGDYLRAMHAQIETFRTCLQASDPWEALSTNFTSLAAIVDELHAAKGMVQNLVIEQLTGLYTRYVQEWEYASPGEGIEMSEGNRPRRGVALKGD